MASAHSLEDDYEMDDFEDSMWETLKAKTNKLLEKKGVKVNTTAVNTTTANITQTNSTQVNQTQVRVDNTTQANMTQANTTQTNATTNVDQRFSTVVKKVIAGYQKMINTTQKEVETKKARLQAKNDKITKDITVMQKQLENVKTQIDDKVKEVETAQKTIEKQQTELSVYEAKLKSNANEKDTKVREQVDKEVRKLVATARKQKREAVKEQQRIVKELRRLFRQKKTLTRDIKESEAESTQLVRRISHIAELTTKKIEELKKVVAWMQKKLAKREEYIAKLDNVRKDINNTLPLLDSMFTTPSKKAQLTETINQLKKVRVTLMRQIKNVRAILSARVSVYQSTRVVKIAYTQRRDKLIAEEKVYRKQADKLNKKVTELSTKIKEQEVHLKKQTVEVLKDISAAKLSELRGKYNMVDTKLRKIQRKLSFLNKAQKKARATYDADLMKIKKEFEEAKIAAFNRAKKTAIKERRRLERRIERLEKAMTDKKYTTEQAKVFSEKAALLRKKLPEATKAVEKASKRLSNEVKKIREEKEMQYNRMKNIAKALKEKENELDNEVSVIREKISHVNSVLEKSGLVEDLHDAVRRLAAAHAKAARAQRTVERMGEKVIEYLKNDLRGERKIVRAMMSSKQRMLKRISVLKDHNEYAEVSEELQHRVEELAQQIDTRKKIVATLESRVAEEVRKRNEEINMKVVEAKSALSRLRAKKESIADALASIVKSSKTDGLKELKKGTKKMKQLKKELQVIKNQEKKVRHGLDDLNKILFIRSIEQKSAKAARKSRKLIAAMKKSSRQVRRIRSKLANNKRLINKLYKSVHETGDIISERAEEKMEQLKNVREVLKNKLRKIMYEHKKLQKKVYQQTEVIKRLGKYRIHYFQKKHAELLKKRNNLLAHKAVVKKQKGDEYYYTQIDLLDEKMNEVMRAEGAFTQRMQKRLRRMVAIAKECERKTPVGMEGIKMKCTMCRNLSAFILQKLRRDRMTPKEVMKKVYNKCEASSYPAQCLRTALKLSEKAFLPANKDLTPKELCYAVGRCVLRV